MHDDAARAALGLCSSCVPPDAGAAVSLSLSLYYSGWNTGDGVRVPIHFGTAELGRDAREPNIYV